MKKMAKVGLCLLFALSLSLFDCVMIKGDEQHLKETINEEVTLHSDYAIFMNLNDNRILYDKNAKQRMYPASMTKIMTTLIAIENIEDIDAKCVISEEMLAGLKEANASVAGFQLEESVSYRDLLYGILLPSGADASRAVAISLFNKEAEFVSKMNEKAKALKMTETHFVNVSGLHDDNHYSSVYDIAILLKDALNNELFKEIFCTSSYQCENGLTLYSTMQRQARNYSLDVSFIYGAKTGFTNEAALCLASYANYQGEDYIMVSGQTHSDSSYPLHVEDAIQLYHYMFSHYTREVVVKKGDVIKALPVKYSSLSTYELKAEKDISVLVKDKDTSSIKKVYNGLDVLEAPIFPLDNIGSYHIYDKDELIFTMDVKVDEQIEKNLFAYYLSNIDQFIIDFKYLIGLFLLTCVGMYSYHIYKKHK